MSRDRLAPAIHSAIRIASAVVRSLRDTVPSPTDLPTDGLNWRQHIARAGAAPTLKDVVTDLWNRGIPVVPVDVLPTPGFQGMACIVENRPVVLLGYKLDEPGRVAFLVAHEAGHIANGDCAPDQPVIDEEDEIIDEAEIETRADQYATQVLVGANAVPQVDVRVSRDFRQLAREASQLERTAGADASSVIFAWAHQSRDYATATMAVKALYRSVGARKQVRRLFDQYVDVVAASETDRALLNCVHGGSPVDEPAH